MVMKIKLLYVVVVVVVVVVVACQKQKNQHGGRGRSTTFCLKYRYSKGCPFVLLLGDISPTYFKTSETFTFH